MAHLSGSNAGDRRTGTVKWFDPEKGYGFITGDDRAPDVFVHWSGIRHSTPEKKASLAEGARVEYSVISDPKHGKPKADDVVGVRT